ncbi:serine/threonine protein kinase [Metapseudomonas otitidis]|uniref:serine/threonine protein kinase n=1 Tax=Metapseudomonas otitidis TaxID=319939 RepID=UPI00244B25CD|nr:serine/threonine-protein kinase [Pseudomonas otitidis]MDG9782606.1 serine/threonine protein kinase [Pseudomonas otitidis]
MILPSRYEIAGSYIKSGMGKIHACKDKHLNRRVVLKLLNEDEEERRLLDEQKALLRVRSKHVVQLYDIIDVGVEGRTTKALVLEYIDGEDLVLGRYKADAEFMKVLWQVSCGLSEIHRSGVIHRDIKPSNIKVDHEGVVKIFDFGLSRSSKESAKTTSAIGTPIFMAPELWSKDEVSFDQSIDVYAFAITALALIEGSMIPACLSAYPPQPIFPGSLDKYFLGIPKPIVAALEQCLSHEPHKRPKISEVELILRRYLLQNKHRALLVAEDRVHELHAGSPSANIKINTLGAVTIHYDGVDFKVVAHEGAVTVNNIPVSVGLELPACCVITFGTRERKFITFDVSNPEVTP